MKNMQTGIMVMKREVNSYKSSFCILKSQLIDLQSQDSLLHPNEQKYYNSLRFDQRKWSYLLGRLASKNAIHTLHPDQEPKHVEIGAGVFGFPVVKHNSNHNIQVSISHCDEYGMVVSYPEEHPLGIDVEKIAECKLSTMRTFIDNEVEKKIVRQLSISEVVGYTILWTVKESLSKVLKTGFTLSSKMLTIKETEFCDGVYLSTFEHFTQYRSITFCEKDFVCSLVLPRNTTYDWHQLKLALNNL